VRPPTPGAKEVQLKVMVMIMVTIAAPGMAEEAEEAAATAEIDDLRYFRLPN